MRIVDKRMQVRRRVLLRGVVTAVPTAALVAAGGVVGEDHAWAAASAVLKPDTLVTLSKVARDIYPHDRIADSFYVNAVKPFDVKAAKDPKLQSLYEDGVAHLNTSARQYFNAAYIAVAEEADRVSLLRRIEHTPFFNHVRSDLVVSFYNQHDLWRRFGYEGSSAEYGGYLTRGFDDVNWLPKV